MTSIANHLLFDSVEAARRPGFLSRLVASWKSRRRVRATLIELSMLDAHLLRDIGIEPDDVHDALMGRHGPSILLHPLREPNRR